MNIYLVPVARVADVDLQALGDALTHAFSRPCLVADVIPLPKRGYDARRGQYLADAFLAALRSVPLPNAERLLGVTDVDLYTSGLNFVFGQAVLNGREAVISLVRLRNSFYSLPDDPALFAARTVKEAVHELGHTYGLSHCPDRHCVMHFSNSLRDTDFKGETFCSACTVRVRH